MIKIGVEGNNTIFMRCPGLGKRFCFAQPRFTFTFYVYTFTFPQGFCVLHLCFTFTFYVLVTFHGLRSRSPGYGYITHTHGLSLYKPNTTVLRYYICNQKILTMTSTHDTTIEMLNDLYLIVAGTDLSNSKIDKTALHAYLNAQIELQEDLAEIERDYWESRD